jgi:hypothetical protein
MDFDVNEPYNEFRLTDRLEPTSPLAAAVQYEDFAAIQLIVAHPRFDPIASDLSGCIFGAILAGSTPIFQFLMAVNHSDLSIRDECGLSLLAASYWHINPFTIGQLTHFDHLDFAEQQPPAVIAASMKRPAGMPVFVHFPFEPEDLNARIQPTFFPPLLHDDEDEEESSNEPVDSLVVDLRPVFAGIRMRQHDCVADLLLSDGFDCSARGELGETILMASVSSVELLESILEQRWVDVNAVDIFGNTALMYAIKDGSVSAVKRLVAAGIDVTTKDHAGRTALDLALLRYGGEQDPKPRTKKEFVQRIISAMQVTPGASLW